MAGRKPPKATFESWIDRQIREGLAKGAFDDLPKRPLELTEHHDEDWWIKRKVREEGIEILPPSLVLRREIERAVATARSATTEDEARRQIEAVNDRIRAANRIAIAGPPVALVAYPVDEFLDRWRSDHPVVEEAPPQSEPPPVRGTKPRWRARRRLRSSPITR